MVLILFFHQLLQRVAEEEQEVILLPLIRQQVQRVDRAVADDMLVQVVLVILHLLHLHRAMEVEVVQLLVHEAVVVGVVLPLLVHLVLAQQGVMAVMEQQTQLLEVQ
jgi:hypothetical protein